MSAPSLVDPPTVTMPTMVSRLPKFGFRPRSQTAPAAAPSAPSASSSRLTNGFYHHPGPAGGDGSAPAPPSAVRQNGFIRVPTSFPMKWRKEGGATEDGEARSVQQQARKPATPPAGKGRGIGQPVTSSLPSPQSSPRTLPVSKTGSRLSPPASGPPKRTQNGVSKPRGALRQPQSFGRPGSRPSSGPGSRSGSPLQKKAPASRSYSSDSLGSAPSVQLTQNDRFRSRSLTQVRRQPSPTLTPSSTSSSPTVTRGNRASSVQAPPRKPPEGGARGGGGVKGRSGPSLLPPAALKKPLLPSLNPASKPSGISYKLSRPSLSKQSRPLRVTPTNEKGGEIYRGLNGRRDSVETPSTTDNSPVEDSPDAPEPEGLPAELVSQREVSIVGETLEDMSLSSTSSLDRNDTSQEYMDDFDNLGNGGVGILLISSKNDEDDSGLDQSCSRFNDEKLPAVNGVTKATGLCFLDDGLDWTGVRLSGEPGENRLNQLSRRRKSSHPEYHEQGGSSLDLSPSDSCGSGGTYMWDEEGLEPLGGAATTASIHTNSNTTHHIGSFDSDINSIDILNNLGSDLADDDLMLDVDFPEEASLHSDGDVVPHMAQWRMRQLCWGTQDVHNDNESDFQCFKLTEDPGNKRKDSTRDGDLILDLCPTRTSCLGLDVEELAEDCSAVRSQLEYLQRLLLQEEDLDDDTLTTDTLSPETVDSSHSSDSQVQVLLQEVQQLREELRSRDRTIAQLTMQLTVPTVTTRCRCLETTGRMDQHTQTSVTERENVASQTPWRDHTSQILHSSNQDDQEPLTTPLPPPTQAPPTQAPPPARHAPADRLPTPPGAEDDGKAQEKGDRRGRSLPPPQPSKLRLFPSSPAPPRATGGSSGVKLRTSGSSRLPKPKSH